MQTDLFQIPSAASVHVSQGKKSFLEEKQFILRLDQVITLAIAAIIAFVIVFTFGVESGRRSERRKAFVLKPSKTMRAAVPKPVAAVLPAVQGAVQVSGSAAVADSTTTDMVQNESPDINAVAEAKEPVLPKEGFAIQLITYNNQSAADKQAKKMQEKGFHSFVVKSGNYYLVCLKGFNSKAMATKTLTALKSQGLAPKDAYIRHMPLG